MSTSSIRTSSEPHSEATVDTILADYHAKESQRRLSTASSTAAAAKNPGPSSEGFKTQHGETPKAMINRVGSFFANMMDARGWRKG